MASIPISAMRKRTAITLLLALLPACTGPNVPYIPPIWDLNDPINKVDQIDAGESTRSDIISLFGEPTEELLPDVVMYTGKSSGGYSDFGGFINERSWWVKVAFDEDNVVEHVWTSEEDRETVRHLENMVREKKTEQIEKGVRVRDPQAMYEYASALNDPYKSWKWFCLAAHRRHPDAQNEVGGFYRWGRGPITKDIVHAYLWYTLAANQGHKAASRQQNFTIEKMTLAQLPEAARLVSEWEPNPAECEVEETAQ